MLKVLIASLVLVITVFTLSPASATEVGNARRVGVGFAIGEPTGLVGKLFLNQQNAVDAGLSFFNGGWSRCYSDKNHWNYCDGYSSHLAIHADYLWQMPLVVGTAKLDWHVGIGGRMWFFSPNSQYSDFLIGVRAPFGLDLTFANPSFLEVFFEVAPILYVIPAAGFSLEPALGVRFYF